MNVRDINLVQLNLFINAIKQYLTEEKFLEISLFNITSYKYSNTQYIETLDGSVLRNNTEPDIWILGSNLEKFYSVSSLFRKEDPLSDLHKTEFKILDFYYRHQPLNNVINLFFKVLAFIEIQLQLPSLSSLKKVFIEFDEYKPSEFLKHEPAILQVKNYPIEESFYDAPSTLANKTNKGEFFFLGFGYPIEFAVYGKLGPNLNPNRQIIEQQDPITRLNDVDLSGMGLGIERLVFCYQYLTLQKL